MNMDLNKLDIINNFKNTEDKVNILSSLEFTSLNYSYGLFIMPLEDIDEFEEINGLYDFIKGYSLVNEDKTPFYCSYNGFMTVEETDKAISEIIDIVKKENKDEIDFDYEDALWEILENIDKYPLK